MTTSEPEYEALSNFFGSYLNQDYPDDFGTAQAAVDAYKREFPADVLFATSEEAARLARLDVEEHQLRTTLLDLGLEYTPWTDGWTAQQWLAWLASDLL